MTDTTISVADSPLPNALDVYYSFLRDIAQGEHGLGSNQKLLLNNTITSFDISKDTPYYNEGLFRNFADRVFSQSPQSIGPANRADRFSLHYEQMVRIACAKIDRKYQDIIKEISAISAEIQTQNDKLTSKVMEIDSDWVKICAQTGLKSSDKEYDLKYISFLESVRYADQIKTFSDNIDLLTGQIDATRRAAYSGSEQMLLDDLSQFTATRKVARPLRPSFERTVPNVNDLTFADPTVRIEALCDISPGILPSGDLVNFLKVGGARNLLISKTSTATAQHDSDWSAGGSAHFSFFGIGIGGSGGGSGSSSYKSVVTHTNTISLSYENVAEYLVDRDMWFNPAIFEDPELFKQLKSIGGLDKFQYVSVSLIIGRGLQVALTFGSDLNVSDWTKKAIQASGGVSLFGYSFGASGGGSTYDFTSEISSDKRTVTFKDDPQLARVLGYRLEPLVALPKTKLASLDLHPKIKEKLGEFSKGNCTYTDLQKEKFHLD